MFFTSVGKLNYTSRIDTTANQNYVIISVRQLPERNLPGTASPQWDSLLDGRAGLVAVLLAHTCFPRKDSEVEREIKLSQKLQQKRGDLFQASSLEVVGDNHYTSPTSVLSVFICRDCLPDRQAGATAALDSGEIAESQTLGTNGNSFRGFELKFRSRTSRSRIRR